MCRVVVRFQTADRQPDLRRPLVSTHVPEGLPEACKDLSKRKTQGGERGKNRQNATYSWAPSSYYHPMSGQRDAVGVHERAPGISPWDQELNRTCSKIHQDSERVFLGFRRDRPKYPWTRINERSGVECPPGCSEGPSRWPSQRHPLPPCVSHSSAAVIHTAINHSRCQPSFTLPAVSAPEAV